MRRALVLLLLVFAGCGNSGTIPESDLVVRGNEAVPARPTPQETPKRGSGLRIASARIAVVTHGQASDSFWAIVKKGVFDAGRREGVAVSYRAPETYDIARMRALIDEAISARLDGLVVSLPDLDGLAPAIRRAERAGIPVVSINSGSDRFRELGILAHVGQPEYRAGLEAGARMAKAGVRDMLCVNQEVGNAGLDARCRGAAAALRRAHGHMRELGVDLQNPAQSQRRIAQAITAGRIDGIITLGPNGAAPALAAVKAGGLRSRVRLATFDLSPDVLQAVRARRMLFAVDQQPYLQGYLPITLLAEYARHQLMPARGLIPTGPQFVTPANASRVLALSRRGYR
jgi:simple sugar transport system substrate-binding protein